MSTTIKMGATGFTLRDDAGEQHDLSKTSHKDLREVGKFISAVRGFKPRYVPPVPPVPLDPAVEHVPLVDFGAPHKKRGNPHRMKRKQKAEQRRIEA